MTDTQDIEKEFNEALNIEDERHQSKLLEVLAPKLTLEEDVTKAFEVALNMRYEWAKYGLIKGLAPKLTKEQRFQAFSLALHMEDKNYRGWLLGVLAFYRKEQLKQLKQAKAIYSIEEN